MSYVGNTNTTQAFTPAIDYFSGNGSTVAFTLSRPVASVAQVQVVVNNVAQNPSTAFTVSGNTITFTGAPSSGTNNIYVQYTSPITQVIAPGQGTVAPASLSQGGPSWDTSGNVTLTGSIALNNGAADGAQLTLSSSGYSDWNWDNYSGRLRAYYGSTEYFTINSSGNVGIGTAPSAWTTFAPVLQIKTGTGAGALTGTSVDNFRMFSNTYYDGAYKRVGAGYATQYEQAAGAHVWYTAGTSTANSSISFTQAMTLDSSGNLLVGTTSATPINARVNGFVIKPNGGVQNRTTSSNSDFAISSSSGNVFNFYSDNGSTAVYSGSVAVNGNTTSYTSVSDYRLKENVQPMAGALAKVQSLNPVTFTFKNGGQSSQGFIAHELQAVVPDAVTGEKDAVDVDGNPVYQGIDTSFLVATLTAAIKEQQAIITQLTERITALEAK